MFRALKLMALLLIVLGGLLCLQPVRKAVLPGVAGWLDIDEHPECARCVMILPGDEIRRGLTAAGLVRIGLAQNVLIPQNPESADVRDGLTLPTAQISQRILQQRGIAKEHIVVLPSQSRTTFDDARALAEYVRDRDTNVTLVTSAFHTRRTRFVFHTVLGKAGESIRVVSAPNPGFDVDNWWQTQDGLRLILTEYCKLAYYYVRYSNPVIILAGLLTILVVGVWRVIIGIRRRQRIPVAAGETD